MQDGLITNISTEQVFLLLPKFYPTMSSPFLFSFSKDTPVSATGYAVGDDRWYSGEWVGHFAEVLAFGRKLPIGERQKIEGYLAHKWGLNGKLPSNHPYKLGHPLSTGSPSFITDTPFSDGKAIDADRRTCRDINRWK